MFITTLDNVLVDYSASGSPNELRRDAHLIVWDYDPTRDRAELHGVLEALEQRQGFVEVLNRSITFVNEPELSSQSIEIRSRENHEFNANDAIAVVMMSPVFFGSQAGITRSVDLYGLRIVFEAVDHGLKLYTTTLSKIRAWGLRAQMSNTGSGGD